MFQFQCAKGAALSLAVLASATVVQDAWAGKRSGGLNSGRYCQSGLDNSIANPAEISAVEMLGPRKAAFSVSLPSDNDHASLVVTLLITDASSTTLDTYDPKRTWYYGSGASVTSYPLAPSTALYLEGPLVGSVLKPGASLKAIAVTYDGSFCAAGRSKVFAFKVPDAIPDAAAPAVSDVRLSLPSNFAGPYSNVMIQFRATGNAAVKYVTVDVDGKPDTLYSCDWGTAVADPAVAGRYPNSSNNCAGWSTHLDSDSRGPEMSSFIGILQGDASPHRVEIRVVDYDGLASTRVIEGVTGIAPK